jgi:hypothetical protein
LDHKGYFPALANLHSAHYFATVPRRSHPKKPVKLQSWRVSIIRKRGQYLGTVEAPNEKAAEAAAVTEFELTDEQRPAPGSAGAITAR